MLRGRLLPVSAIAFVVLAIGTGLVMSGSPLRQRELRLDDARVADLRRLSNALSRYYDDTGFLPGSLEQLVDGRTLTTLPRDPASEADYGYRPSGAARFALCAEFSHEADATRAGEFWAHAAGPECFDFDYSARRPRPN